MEDRVLLINKRREVVDEFVNAYASENFEVEVAYTGAEALKKLQSTTYKVIVTGSVLPDVEGSKLLAYIRNSAPDTSCIVYTTAMNVGQLAYLKNTLHVFRIFLRPTDYRGEMLTAIQEGIEAFDVTKEEAVLQKESKESEKEHEQRFEDMRQRVLEQNIADDILLRLLDPVISQVSLISGSLPKEQEEKILEVEKEVIKLFFRENNQPAGDLMAIEVKLRHRFFEGMEGKNLFVDVASNVMQFSEDFVKKMYLCLWLIIYRINMLTKAYNTTIFIDFETSTKLTVNVLFEMDPTVWESQGKRKISRVITDLFESMVGRMCEGIRKTVQGEQVVYHLAFDVSTEPVFQVK